MFGVNKLPLKQPGDIIRAGEWNQLVNAVSAIQRSTMTDGIMDSTGFHPRRKISTPLVIHKAYCKTDSGEGSTIQCYLDRLPQAGGENPPQEIDVQTILAGESNLSSAFPHLAANDLVLVVMIDSTWYLLDVFHPAGDSSVYAVVTRGLLYPDAARQDGPTEGYSQYLLQIPPSTQITALPRSQEAVLGTASSTYYATAPDMRHFVPWFKVGSIIKLELRNGFYFFQDTMTRVVKFDGSIQSIKWNDVDDRMMGTYA